MQYIPPINGDTGNPDRSYINANPALGIEGSIPPAAAFENVQREILEVITHAGLVPEDADLTQLRQAINILVASATIADASTTVKGKVELADNTEALGGTDTTRAVTSAGLASVKSLALPGYMKLPGGLIIQWGRTAQIAPSTTGNTTLPLTFPNSGLLGVATFADGTATTRAVSTNVSNLSTSQISIRNPDASNSQFNFIAIGY